MTSPSTSVRRVTPAPSSWDRARFYEIDGARYPSVTTILDIINKPALGPWYAKMERQAYDTAILEVADEADKESLLLTGSALVDQIAKRLTRVKAADREKQKAADIGSGAHAWIEWETRRRLGQKVGREPQIPDGSLVAVMSWQDWAKEVGFKPLACEFTVFSTRYGFAGTVDWVAEVERKRTLGDYKTSKAIYPESFLQNRAYRHALTEMGREVERGMIVRLPKTLADPSFEALEVPHVDLEEFLAACTLWRCMRRLEGKDSGSRV